MKHLFALNKYIFRYKKLLFFGLLFVTLSNYFSILQPRLIRQALDLVVNNLKLFPLFKDSAIQAEYAGNLATSLLLFALLVIGSAILMGVFLYYMRQTIIVMSRYIEYDLRKDIFIHYTTLDQAFFRRNKTGDLMSRITEDVSKVRMYLGPAIMYGINLVTLFILVIGSMLEVNAELTFYTLLPLPILSITIYLISNKINQYSEAIQQQLARLNSIAQEIYSGIRVVKSYVQEKFLLKYFEHESATFKTLSLGFTKVDSVFFPLIIFFTGISTIITVYIGGIKVNQGTITAGNVAEFVIYVNMLTWPVTAIGWIASIIQQAAASQKRINEFWLTRSSITSGEVNFQITRGDIAFDQVSFTYEDTGIQALKQVSFEIAAGEKLGLLGRTAAGKTTIADLILRMYDPQEGEVRIDGQPIKSIPLKELRAKIGYVPQDVFLFSDTIQNNIGFGLAEAANMDDVEKVSKQAAVHADISNLPKGYQTVIGERGVSLSGGQKQRISIARAFIKKTRIIILDDCLSAVDPKTESHILDSIYNQLAGNSVLMITHRAAPLLNFDRIIILDRGKIVEMGTPEDLLELKGVFYKVLEDQRIEEE